MKSSLTSRRAIIATMAGQAMWPSISFAKSDQPGAAATGSVAASSKPYDAIDPPIKADINRVRFLFSYECPYCRSYHNGLRQWGASLPKPFTFDTYPLITSVDNDKIMNAVIGHMIVKAVAPKSLEVYDFAIYTAIQGDPELGQPPSARLSMDDVMRIVIQSGATPGAVKAYLAKNASGVEGRLQNHWEAIKTYNVKATPSVAMVGKFIVNPDHAQANPQQFLMLLNGIVSRIIQGGTNAL